jgi:DNA-binding MurR/RpiR family transcriptional regulator
LIGLGPGDLVIVISFRRVDRVSVDVLLHARDVGAATLAIADHRSSAVARAAEASLIVQIGTLRLMPSFAPGASLINAVLEAVAARLHDTAEDRLREAELVWDRFRSYADS